MKSVYFLGIGGIGMSALARYYQKRGVEVHGYDKTKTPLTIELEEAGMHIHYEDRPDLIPKDLDLAIWTPAIPKDMAEYAFLKQSGTPFKKRSVVLGELTAGKVNVAVAGTHGKTTTSCLVAHVLADGGLGITAFLGGIAVNYQSNYIDTGDAIMVEEADEYDRSFLQLHPDVGIIGSLDADHLDIYGTREQMVDSYVAFARQIKPGGLLLLSDSISDADRQMFRTALPQLEIQDFGFQSEEVQVRIESQCEGWIKFEYITKKIHIKDVLLRLPGQHNIRNACAAIRVALHFGLSPERIKESLAGFKGIRRRFEWCLDEEGRVLIDDYAHHPEELRAVIQACRDIYPGRCLTGIFQPHLYSRTRDFMKGFAEVLSGLDRIILVEIYPARELPIPGIDSEALYNAIEHPDKWITEKKNLLELLGRMDLEVVMTLGAGDLDLMTGDIVQLIKEKYKKSDKRN